MLTWLRSQNVRDAAGIAIGAVAGTTARYSTVAVWPDPIQVFVSTLATVALGATVLGLLSTDTVRRDVRAVVAGFVGSAASIALLALLAISAGPLLCLAYVLGSLIAALAGLTVGVTAGLAIRKRAQPHVARA